jgi:hypothetical protein
MKRNAPVKSGRQASRPVLHLTLHREFFDAIAEGSKKTEYRTTRLIGDQDWSAENTRRSSFEMATPRERHSCGFSFSASAKKDPTVL